MPPAPAGVGGRWSFALAGVWADPCRYRLCQNLSGSMDGSTGGPETPPWEGIRSSGGDDVKLGRRAGRLRDGRRLEGPETEDWEGGPSREVSAGRRGGRSAGRRSHR